MTHEKGASPGRASWTRRRAAHRGLGLCAAAAIAAATLSACGTGQDYSGHRVTVPDYYPSDYATIVEASKKEGGGLTIYSSTDQQNWAPIFEAFQRKYPWVDSINATNLDSDEVFQRVLSEQATGQHSADFIATGAADAWGDFAARPGTVAPYRSPEHDHLPEFAEALPSVYTLSVDPISIIYNTALLEDGQRPTGIADLAAKVEADPETYDGAITVRNPKGAFGFTVTRAFVVANPDAWDALAEILPLSRNETSTGAQIEKVTAGEYAVGFFMGSPALTAEQRTAGLVKTVFPEDGTPLLRRGMSILQGAPHPATAKLFTDFVLSAEGQAAVAEGGLTAYRPGVQRAADGVATYSDVIAEVGEQNTILIPYTKASDEEVRQFADRWSALQAG
ncbi:ABC transporter substrate-binding protein [Nocardia testacea]|uniref:ABC transporter substrate-binding protein n=1 Tax=Nocardia testacea TaxID=248551 RepID=A0ABW7VTK5_9NOCA